MQSEQFEVDAANTKSGTLIDAVLAVIASGARSVVRLVPVRQSGFKLGTHRGVLGTVPDFTVPMDDADLDLWEGGGGVDET